jgi:UDP-N-acetylmuramyl pentapeptide phosphotransferase/UDP-N-acetylglucosamine-1-phosphate transferase
MLGGNEWDDFGRLAMAVGLMALVAYLAPAAFSLAPTWARRFELAAAALLALALLAAIIAFLAWQFLR